MIVRMICKYANNLSKERRCQAFEMQKSGTSKVIDVMQSTACLQGRVSWQVKATREVQPLASLRPGENIGRKCQAPRQVPHYV